MNGCLKCIHKPFCTLSACGAVCSSFKDKDQFADRNEVIREFAERLKKKIYPYNGLDKKTYAINAGAVEKAIDDLVKETTEEISTK